MRSCRWWSSASSTGRPRRPSRRGGASRNWASFGSGSCAARCCDARSSQAGRAALGRGDGAVPARLQLSRRKGFRLPPTAVKVDRSTPFGNPFRLEEACPHPKTGAGVAGGEAAAQLREAHTASRARFARWVAGDADEAAELPEQRKTLLSRLRTIRGCDLACWCHLCPAHASGRALGVGCEACMPCHTDVLLALANAAPDRRDARPAADGLPSATEEIETRPR